MTQTATATRTPGPLVIRMSEDDARARLLAILDPEGQPEIGLIRLLTVGQIEAYGPSSHPTLSTNETIYWWRWFVGDGNPAADRPVLFAVASCMDIELTSLAASEHSEAQRIWLAVLYDAVTGEELAYGTFHRPYGSRSAAELVAALSTLPTPAVDPARSAALRLSPTLTITPRPTRPGITRPSPTVPPAPPATLLPPPVGSVRLVEQQLTTDQRAAIEGFPLREGTQWTYRYVQRADFRWSTSLVTVEVRSAWLTPRDVPLWRTEMTSAWVSRSQYRPVGTFDGVPPSGPGAVFSNPEKDIAYHAGTFYENDGLRAITYEYDHEPVLEPLPRLGWWPLLRVPIEITDPPTPWTVGPLDLDSPDMYRGFQAVRRERVSVPAGEFDDCYVLRLPIGAGATHWRWFCSGVGFVREEGYGNNPGYFQAKLELVEFRPGAP